MTVSLATGTGSGGDAEGDTLSGIETIRGSNSADTLTGDGFANTLLGGNGGDTLDGSGGNDVLVGGAGADSLIGGGGTDTANYSASTAGVNVNLLAGTGLGGDAEGDTLSGIEIVLGSNHADTLTGDGFANTLSGGSGNDTINGGDGDDTISGGNNADVLDGGNGIDTLNAGGTLGHQTINLATNAISGGDSTGDTIANFENVLSGEGNDTITGSSVANVLNGSGGNDTITGGAGADTMIGGIGADTFVFTAVTDSTNAARDVISDFTQAQLDKINLQAIDAISGGSDNSFVLTASGGTGAFTNTAGELRFFAESGNTVVEGDVDGNGVADFQILLTGSIALTASDFLL